MDMERPTWEAPAQEQPENDLNLTPEEQAFMDRAHMTAAELAQYKRWKKLEESLGMDKAA